MLQALRYGFVQITVQDGLIVQIDRSENRRCAGRKEGTTEAVNH